MSLDYDILMLKAKLCNLTSSYLIFTKTRLFIYYFVEMSINWHIVVSFLMMSHAYPYIN